MLNPTLTTLKPNHLHPKSPLFFVGIFPHHHRSGNPRSPLPPSTSSSTWPSPTSSTSTSPLPAWLLERWLVPVSNWVPLAFAIWVTMEMERDQLIATLESIWRQEKLGEDGSVVKVHISFVVGLFLYVAADIEEDEKEIEHSSLQDKLGKELQILDKQLEEKEVLHWKNSV